jgi:hypothetical protein
MDTLSIISKTLPPAPAGLAYDVELQAIGGTPPYTWSLVSGAFPSGVSLSPSGTLTAIAGAIPLSGVGTYSFRLKVVDDVAAEDAYDFTLEVSPEGYDRLPEFQIETRFRDLISRLLLLGVDRRKIERHFFRDLLGDTGDTYAHLVRDIMAEDWPSPGTDTSLRDVIDDIVVSVGEAIKTINGVPPDLSDQDFEVQAGTGINVNPTPNGLVISSDIAGQVDKYETSGAVDPDGTLEMVLGTMPHAAQAWVKEEQDDLYYQAGTIPYYAGKYLDPDTLFSDGQMAMATGERTGTPVLHVLYWDGSNVVIDRYHAETLAHEESRTLPGSSMLGEPWIQAGPNGLVVFAYLEPGTPNTLYYGEFDPADYAGSAAPASVDYVSPGYNDVQPCQHDPSGNVLKVLGTLGKYGVNGSWFAYIGLRLLTISSNDPGILEIPLGGGGAVSASTVDNSTPSTAENMDLTFDFTNQVVLWLVVGDQGGASSNSRLRLWTATANGLGTVLGPLNVTDGVTPTVADGYQYQQAAVIVDPDTEDAVLVAFVYADNVPGSTPYAASLRYVRILAYSSFPGSSVGAVTQVERPSRVTYPYDSRFGRWWVTPAETRLVFIDPQVSDNAFYLKRVIFDVLSPMSDSEVLIRKAEIGADAFSGVWTRTVLTNTLLVNDAANPRAYAVLGGDGIFVAIDPWQDAEGIKFWYDDVAKKMVAKNLSPFTWDMKIDALVHQGEYVPPPNLLIPCYQVAQGLRMFYDDAGFYPSPSVSGGVTWTESQLSSSNTSGYVFSSYYSVTPGNYDLKSGQVAGARYYADESAGAASDQALVFRYATMPPSMLAAETVIKAAVDAYIGGTGPLPHGTGANPNFYTLPELDAILGTTFASTYSGAPFDYYRYFLFDTPAGTSYEHGWFSQNYVDTGIAYGPHPSSNLAIPQQEFFTVASDATTGVSTYFDLPFAVSSAIMYINGIRYYREIDWRFDGVMNRIEYFNRAGSVANPGYTLHADDEVVFDMYLV